VDLNLVQRWYPIHSALIVHLTGGRSAEGTLAAVDGESLVLQTPNGPTLLLASAIDQVERGSTGTSAPTSPPASPPPATAALTFTFSPAWHELAEQFIPATAPPHFSPLILRRDPELIVSDSQAAAVDREMTRAANQHAHTLKIHEPQRISQTIRVLTELADEWKYPPALHAAALLLLGDGTASPAMTAQAEQWLEQAAYLGGAYAWDLAVLYLRTARTTPALDVLAQALAEEPPNEVADPMLRLFLDLVIEHGDPAVAVHPLRALGDAGRQTAIHAGLYLIFRLRAEQAPAVDALVTGRTTAPNDLERVLAVLSPSVSDAAPAGHTTPRPPSVSAAPAPQPSQPMATAGQALDNALLTQAVQRQFPHDHSAQAAEIARKRPPVATPAPKPLPPPPPPKTTPRPANSLYAQAQHAETKLKNYARAEDLYRRAIEAGDNTERSVRSLAWLLHGRKRSEEALSLLHSASDAERRSLPHQNILSTIFGDLGQWAESAEVLQRALARPHPQNIQIGLLKRLIRAHQQSRDYAKAKSAASRLLTINPGRAEFRDIVAELDKVERTGMFNRLDVLLTDSDWKPDQSRLVSPLLALNLTNCEFKGINPAKVQSNRLAEKDVAELETLINRLGVHRSADRAAYNLSAARILRELGLTEDDRFRKSLRFFAAAMGDLCAAERRPADVTRAYYAEAIILCHGWDTTADVKLRQFVLSYHPKQQTSNDPPHFEKSLTSVLEVKAIRRSVLIGLLSVANYSEVASREISNRTFTHKELRGILFEEICLYLTEPVRAGANDQAYAEAWQDALRAYRQDFDGQRQSLLLLLNRPDPLVTLDEDQEELARIRSRIVTTQTDRARLTSAATILSSLRNYLDQSSYLEQERLELMNRTELHKLSDEIKANPTPVSLEYLVPLLKHWETALGKHFTDVRRAAEPTELVVALILPSYVPNASTISVQLSVTNAARRSPAGNVTLRVLDNPEDYQPVSEPIPVAHTLRDAQSESCNLPLVVTERAIADKVLTLKYVLEFDVRSGERVVTDPEALTLRLFESAEFHTIFNPFSEGAPVEDEEMFYGREPLLDSLVEALEHSEAKSVVFYGQKRAGKSTVLIHLEKRLRPPMLAARLSLLDLATQLNHSTLLYKIARAFYSRLEDLCDAGYPQLDVPEPRLAEFTVSGAPQIHFDEYMSRLRQQMRRTKPYEQWRLILLLDEFTMLYAAIEQGELPRGFMKSWKAMLERKLFSSVVVGNDLMPTFLAAYPNEFQVARQERLSYLDRKEAERLIIEPVVLPDGDSRYKGDSVARILDLTARNPYYVQLFCNRLIERMNAERQPLIGPADVDNVAEALVHGDKSLTREQFDNLLTPGDAEVSALSAESAMDVLKGCLSGHRRALYLDGRRAADIQQGPQVLEDLVRRDVIEHESEERYRIKVGLFAEWLWARRA